MKRFYEIFRKEKAYPVSTLPPQYQTVYDVVAYQRSLIQSKKKYFDAKLARLDPPKDSAAKAKVQTLKLDIGHVVLACEEELRRGEEMLKELLRAETAAAAAEQERLEQEHDQKKKLDEDCYYLPVTQPIDKQATRIIADVNHEIELARRIIREMTLAIEAEPRPRKEVKMDTLGSNSGRESRVSVYETSQYAASEGDLLSTIGARLSKPPRVMKPRMNKLAKPEPPARVKKRQSAMMLGKQKQEKEGQTDEDECRTDRVTRLY